MNTHQHLIATALLEHHRFGERDIRDYLLALVERIGMRVLDGPLTSSCDDAGNEGLTGIILLNTSHASIHTWLYGGNSDGPFAQIDVFSCKEFSPDSVLDLLREYLPVSAIVAPLMIDRTPSIWQ